MSPIERVRIVSGDSFSKTSIKISDGDFAAVRISGVSVIARCPQGES